MGKLSVPGRIPRQYKNMVCCLCLGSVLTFALPVLLGIWEFLLPLVRKFHSSPTKITTASAVAELDDNNFVDDDGDKEKDDEKCCQSNDNTICENKKNV